MPNRTATCAGCGVTYTTQSNRSMYCTNACREWHHRHPGATRPPGDHCVTCGAPKTNHRGRFCSPACRPTTKRGRTVPPRSTRQRTMQCAFCSTEFSTARANAKYCSEWCSDTGTRLPGSFDVRLGRCCERCGTDIPRSARVNQRFCSVSCQVCHNQEMRRARKRGLPAERISRRAVFDRDGWVCHICLEQVLTNPVIDHLVPLAVSGSPGHVMENVATAHEKCNFSKGARVRPEDYDLYIRLSLGGSVTTA